MKKLIPLIILIALASCRQPTTLKQQLYAKFNVHLKRIEPSATLDSLQILWKVSLTKRLGKVIDDTIYMRELTAIQLQLNNAKLKQLKDSISYYQSETAYVQNEADSIARQIDKTDSTKKSGYMMRCAYYITSNSKSKMDSTLVIIDSSSTLMFTDVMDSSISQTLKSLK